MVDFSRDSENDFSRGDKRGKISLYPLKSKKITFFAKNL